MDDDLKPIETAVRDASARLLFVPDDFGGEYHVGWWVQYGWVGRDLRVLAPSHWTDLPPKPADGGR